MNIELDEKVLAEQNMKACATEIEETLKKYGLYIKPILISSEDGIIPTIVLAKRQETKPVEPEPVAEPVTA
jgi:hypothetical protein